MCQYHPNEKWLAFSDAEITDMASDALEWWAENRPIVAAIMDSLKAFIKAGEEVK